MPDTDIRYNVHVIPAPGHTVETSKTVTVLEDYTRGGATIALRRTTCEAGFSAGELVATFPVGVNPLRLHLHGHAHPSQPVTLANFGPEQLSAVARAAVDSLGEQAGWDDLTPQRQERVREAVRRALGSVS